MDNSWALTTIELPILEVNKPLKNGIVFTTEMVDKLIFKDELLMELLNNHSLYGETRPDTSNRWYGVINILQASHCTTQLELRANVLYGTIDVLETPQGRILNSFLSQGCKPCLQPRLIKVDDVIEVITFDIDFLNRC